ncbi:MAG: dTDP-4-dehydrorhamnose 3,5-epimerase [Gemmatimonas sp.]
MKIIQTSLADVVVVESPVFGDERGFFNEVFRTDKFAALGLPDEFVQDNHSRSAQDVLRGLHFQRDEPQGKLVRAVSGAIFDVAVDLRRSSPTFGQWFGTELRAGDGRALWVPAGLAHGFVVLSESADVFYKCTALYNPRSEECLAWNDPTVGIQWPPAAGGNYRLSGKDAMGARFETITPFA